MSWSAWELPELGPDASRRTVLLGGGRGLVVGAEYSTGRVEEELDQRWLVSRVTVPASGVVPRIGDITVWSGYTAKDRDNPFLWNAPCRAVDVRTRDNDSLDVFCLEDTVLIDATPDLEPEDLDRLAPDRVLHEEELWEILSWWHLLPRCPRCGAEVWPIAYGLLVGEPTNAYSGGCVITSDDPAYRCTGCTHEQGSIWAA